MKNSSTPASLDQPIAATKYFIFAPLHRVVISFLATFMLIAFSFTAKAQVTNTTHPANSPYASIQAAIDDGITVNGDIITVGAGTYNEDIIITKTLKITGAGAASTFITGPIGGPGSTVVIAANNAELSGFTISRAGNNITDWSNSGLNTAGISVQGQSISGSLVHDNIITGNRTGIDINNSNGHTIRNNSISNNRTGLIFRNQTDNIILVENEVTNNWTVGIVFLDGSGGTNVPVQTTLNCNFSNNNISGNWYAQIVDRQIGGSIPIPATTNLKNFSGNWWGTITPVVTTSNSSEPGYDAQIPTAFGGTATPPGGQPDIAGPASPNFDITPYLHSGTDTEIETSAGRGTFGFQGNFSHLWVTTAGSQTGATSRLQEGINSVTTGGIVSVTAGTFDIADAITINKSVFIQGKFVGVSATAASRGDESILSDSRPAATNPGAFTISTTSAVEIDGFTFNGSKIITGQPANAIFALKNNRMILAAMPNGSQTNMIWSVGNQLTLTNNYFETTGSNPSNSAVMQVAGGYAGSGTTDMMIVTGNYFKGIAAVPYNNGNGQSTLQLNFSDCQGNVSGNTFDGVDIGILVAGNSGNLSITGNTFENIKRDQAQDIPQGFYGTGILIYSPTYTGPINITGNTFQNSDCGIRSSNAGGTETGTNIQIIGNTFTGNLFDIVHKYPTATLTLDGTNIMGGATLYLASLAQLFAIEDKILHKIDVAGYGLVKVTTSHLYVTTNSFFAPGGTTTASIQRGIDAASAGWAVFVDAGTFNENVLLNKSVQLIGVGNTTVIDPSTTCNGIGINITADNSAVQGLKVTDFSKGIFVNALNVTLVDLEVTANCNSGIEFGTSDHVQIYGTTITNNIVGLRVGSGAVVSYVTMENCEVHNNTQGIYAAYESALPVPGTFDHITIRNSDFSTNLQKGMYFEKLSNALIENIVMNNAGTDPTYNFNTGIDINLKWAAYSNITIQKCEFTNCGVAGPGGIPFVEQSPVVIAVKARDDGSTYGATPATLTNVSILNNIINGPQNGIRFGEFGKTNNTPTGVVVHDNHLGAAFANRAIINNTGAAVDASCNWFGSADVGTILPKISGNVTYQPFLTNGTDDEAGTPGFQPVAGACSGTQTEFYVNDNDQTGDQYTTAVGNDANFGTAGSPFATIQHAINVAPAGSIIKVDAGTYVENIIVNKRLSIGGGQNSYFAPSTFINTSTIGGNAITISADGTDGVGNALEIQNIRATGKSADITNNNDYGILVTVPAYYLNLYNVYADNYRFAGLKFSGGYSAATAAHINIWDCQFQANDLGIDLDLGMNGVYIKGGVIKNNRYSGLITAGNDAGILTNIKVEGTQFFDNGTGGLALSTFASDIFLQRFNGNGIFKDLTFTTYAATAFDLRGKGALGTPTGAAGTVVIENCTFTGQALDANAYNKDLIKIRNYTDISGITFNGATLNTRDFTSATGLRFESVTATTNYTLTGISFPNAGSGFGHGFDIYNSTPTNINATSGVTFASATNFQIEDRIAHKIDNTAWGLVTWVANNDYVTANSFISPVTAPSIQRGIDAASAGWTVNIGAGTFDENVLLNRSVTLKGVGNTTVIDPSTTCNGIGINITAGNSTVQDLKVTDFSKGIFVNASQVTLSGLQVTANCVNGIELGTSDHVNILGSTITNNIVGLRVGSGAVVSYVTMENCEVHNNTQGIYVAYESAITGSFDHITIRNSDFSTNLQKGMYFEKLSNALIENILMNNAGTDPTYNFNAGIDINLKWAAYSNITIQNCEFTNCGVAGPGNATFIESPVVIAVKARDDAPTYNGTPASLSNVSILNNIISGPQNGIRFGEFGKTNTTPTGVVVHYNHLGAAFANKAIINNTGAAVDASCNWFGTIDPPTIAGKITGTVNYTPYSTNGTDATPAVRGFQPVVGACDCTPVTPTFSTITDPICQDASNKSIFVRTKYNLDAPAKWNSMTAASISNLHDEDGTPTGVGVAFDDPFWKPYDAGPNTFNNSGVYPDVVLREFYYFGYQQYFPAPNTVNVSVTGLDPAKKYKLTFYAGSNFNDGIITNNGTTKYTVGATTVELAVENNTQNTVSISDLSPDAGGTIVFTMNKGANTDIGYLNALVISPSSVTLPTTSTNTIPVTGTWSPASVNTAVPGTNNYTFTPDPGQCANPVTLSITVAAAPTADAGTDKTTCGVTPVAMTATGTGTWTGFGAGIMSSNTDPHATFTANASQIGTTVTLTWTVTNTCGSDGDDVMVTVNTATVADAGADKTTCGTTAVNMSATGTGTWSGFAPGIMSNPNSPTASFTPDASQINTTVILTWTVSGIAPCTGASDNVNVEVTDCACTAPPSVAITETSVNVCGTSPATFNYTVANGPASVSTNGTGILSVNVLPNGTSTFTYTPSPAEANAGATITVTATIADPDGSGINGPCTSSTDVATVVVTAAPTANAGSDKSTCDNTAVAMSATGTGVWSGFAPGSMSNSNSSTASFTPHASQTGTTVVLTWTVTGTAPCGNATDQANVVVNNCAGLKLIPGKIEAESYDAHQGGMYAVSTSDAGGGQQVIGITPNSWMDYNVVVTQSGNYNVSFRVATPQLHAQFQVKLGNTVLGTIDLPNTGEWNIWATYTLNNVPLSAGPQTLRILSSGTETCNFNWMEYALAGGNQPPVVSAGSPQTIVLPATLTLNGSASDPDGINNVLWSFTGKPIGAPDPIIASPSNLTTTVSNLVAGSYTFKLTATDNPGASSNSSVVITVTNSAPPTVNAGPAQTITLPVSQVTLNGSATANNGGSITSHTWTQTGGSAVTIQQPSNYSTLVTGFTLPGVYTFRLTAQDNDGTTAFNEMTVTVNSASGTTKYIPGKIEAESYDAHQGGMYAVSTSDAGGGQQVIGITPNSWMDYNVVVTQSGNYNVSFRVATPQLHAQFQVKLGNTVLGTIDLPNTGEWNIWATYTLNNVPLSAGPQTLRILSSGTETCNFNWMEYALAGGNQPPVVSAGSPQTIVLPATLTLNGSASDPDGINNVLWSFTGKPIGAPDPIIASPSNLTTTVSNLVAGSYTFKLTATDNPGASSNSSVVITVTNSAPPTVNAGPAQTITLPVSQVTLNGSATANNGGSITFHTWTQTGGSAVTIQQPSNYSTLVTGFTLRVFIHSS
ncbi:MAG: carbohydrate-binding protein [Chitinophagaceae bacterium]